MCIRDSFHIGTANNGSMVFHDDCIKSFSKFSSNLFSQLFASRKCISCITNWSANIFCLWNYIRIGDNVCNTERYQSRWMRMDNGFDIRTHLINSPVEWIFGRGFVFSQDCSISLDTIDVIRPKRALVDCRRSNPNIALFVDDRNITSRGGGHPVVIDPTNNQYNLITWMHKVDVK